MCSIELVLFTRERQYRLPSDKNPDVIIQLAVVPPSAMAKHLKILKIAKPDASPLSGMGGGGANR